MKEITLYFTQGSSDKIYQVRLFESKEGYMISYANAKRGRALNHKPKNKEPLTLEAAEKEFNKIIKSKAKSGYTTNEDGTPHSGIDLEGKSCESSDISPTNIEHSDIMPQLLTEINYEKALQLCKDPMYCAQQKHDGERRLLQRTDSIKGINKKGFYTVPTPSILESASEIASDNYVIDGEDMGQLLWIFDLLEYNGEDLKDKPYKERYECLKLAIKDTTAIKVVETAFSEEEKRDLMSRIKDKNLEGIVFKRIDELYSSGKGGEQFKYKFFDETSVIVTSISKTKRSVEMAIMDNGERVSVGKVTIPSNTHIPEVDSIIEVKYLYAYKGGSLFTTSFLKHRNDVDHSECDISRIKFKPEVDNVA